MIMEQLLNHPALMYSYLAIFSLLVGSLLNVIIYRLPIMLQHEWEEQAREILNLPPVKTESINLFFPRSFCPHCKHQVSAWQNIPIISYLLLRGKCGHCKAGISLRYPAIELLTMLVSIFALWHFGPVMQLPFILLGLWLLICMVFIDLDHQLLPDSLTYSFLWLGLMINCSGYFVSLQNAVLSAVGAYLFLWTLIKVFYLITGKIGMGNGDFKLFAAFAAWVGWTQLPLILLVSSLSGAIIGYTWLKTQGQSTSTPIPFGPFLCLGGLISIFFGSSVLSWYLSFWM